MGVRTLECLFKPRSIAVLGASQYPAPGRQCDHAQPAGGRVLQPYHAGQSQLDISSRSESVIFGKDRGGVISKPGSIGLTVVVLCFLGRSSPFSYAPFEIFKVLVHLLKRESEREEAFRCVAGKTSRDTLATERGDLGGIGIKSRFHGIE